LEDKSGENECENGAGGSERTCYRYGAYLQGAIQREESQRSTHSSKDSDETAECKGCQREGKIPEPESDCSEREQPEQTSRLRNKGGLEGAKSTCRQCGKNVA